MFWNEHCIKITSNKFFIFSFTNLMFILIILLCSHNTYRKNVFIKDFCTYYFFHRVILICPCWIILFICTSQVTLLYFKQKTFVYLSFIIGTIGSLSLCELNIYLFPYMTYTDSTLVLLIQFYSLFVVFVVKSPSPRTLIMSHGLIKYSENFSVNLFT